MSSSKTSTQNQKKKHEGLLIGAGGRRMEVIMTRRARPSEHGKANPAGLSRVDLGSFERSTSTEGQESPAAF